MSNNNLTSSGVGFMGLLTIAFIVLKLTKLISWSWWWVLSPIWVSVGFWILIVIIAFVIGLIFYFEEVNK